MKLEDVVYSSCFSSILRSRYIVNIKTASADVLIDSELFVLAATMKAKITILNCIEEFVEIHFISRQYPYNKTKNMGIPYITIC